MKQIQIEKTGNPASILGHVGSVLDVIAAKLPKNITSRRLKAADFAYGFELATPRGIESVGETVILNGTCYATSTDKSSADYNKTIHGPEFVTGGVFLIPHDAKPCYRARLDSNEQPIPLIDCYNYLYDTIQEPLAFVGLIEFAHFHGTAIGKPPIDGKNIFAHKSDYYPNPPISVGNTYGFVMGAITNYHNSQFDRVNQQLKVVLYDNPEEKSSTITYHAHVLTLKTKVKTIQEVTPSVVDQTLHLFCEGSLVKTVTLDIFTIKALKDYQ